MLNASTVTFAGNLAADPEVRFTAAGKAVAEIRVMVNRRVRNDAGDGYVDAEPTAWTCTIWGGPAENVAESLTKGDRVLVTGRVETDTWTDQATGEKRTKPVVIVEEIATSLTWATARPTKTNRQDTNTSGGAGE